MSVYITVYNDWLRLKLRLRLRLWIFPPPKPKPQLEIELEPELELEPKRKPKTKPYILKGSPALFLEEMSSPYRTQRYHTPNTQTYNQRTTYSQHYST